MMGILKWIRRVAAILVLLLFGAGLLGIAAPADSPWLFGVERVQFVPTLLGTLQGKAWAGIILAALLLLTLLYGRVYCSWLCPLGIGQDIVNRLVRPFPSRLKAAHIRHTPNHWLWRTAFALAAFGALAAGSVAVLSWLDPYTLAARFGAAVFNPLFSTLGADEPDWSRYAPWLMALACAGILPAVIMAAFRGRLYCNTICPVGAVLGLLARVAPCTPHINPDRCGRCASCMRHCKAHAIDLRTMRVDATRCVACYDCLSSCRNSAMTLSPHSPFAKPAERKPKARRNTSPGAAPGSKGEKTPESPARRAFLGLGMAAMAAAALPEVQEPADRNPAARGNNTAAGAVPAGAGSVERFLDICTGCGLCISACPTHVLRPSLLVHGFKGMMKPWLDYSRGFCQFDCHACSDVCPAGALQPLDLARKQRTQIALADFVQQNCNVWNIGHECAQCAEACPTGALTAEPVTVPFVLADKCTGCRRCSRVCPHGAITMVEVPGRVKANGQPRLLSVIDRSRCVGCGACFQTCTKHHAIEGRPLKAPYLETRLCIGCGACTHICPAPAKAMVVTPRAVHLTAESDR